MLNIYFFNFVICKYDMIFFFIFKRLGRMQENKIFFYNFSFSTFWRKPSILVSDLYLYGIKIQTNIKQNSVEKYTGKSQIF